jgi:amino acid adenylation domain-containing protein
VTLTHGNALCFVEWAVERMGVTAQDRLSNHAPLHFDLSVFDLFVAAAAGATVVLVPDELSFFGSELSRLIRDEAITTWYSVPSTLTMIARSGAASDLVSLRSVVFAGEVFPTARLRALRAMVPQAELWNLYGPTETNVCTYQRVGELPEDDRPIPIGRPCEYDEVFALREDGGLADVGELGELYVRGRSVMRGYWGRTEATEEALVPDPLDRPGSDRVYRTGDLVRLRPDGAYEFHGRRDHQIKSRGYRIELAEVETALVRHPSVESAAAVAVPHEEWGSAIVAFVSLTGSDVSERELRQHVGTLLPRYMVPAEIVITESLPRTSTGKVDRGRLVDLRQPVLGSETRSG